MPGDKCSVVGCGSCRRTKGIGNYMKAAALKNEAHRKWRENWLHELTKSTVVDAELNKIDRKRQSFHK